MLTRLGSAPASPFAGWPLQLDRQTSAALSDSVQRASRGLGALHSHESSRWELSIAAEDGGTVAAAPDSTPGSRKLSASASCSVGGARPSLACKVASHFDSLSAASTGSFGQACGLLARGNFAEAHKAPPPIFRSVVRSSVLVWL